MKASKTEVKEAFNLYKNEVSGFINANAFVFGTKFVQCSNLDLIQVVCFLLDIEFVEHRQNVYRIYFS